MLLTNRKCFFISFFFFSSRRRHTRFDCDWSSDVCSSDLWPGGPLVGLSLYERPALDFLVEAPVIVAGWLLYRRSLPALSRNSRYSMALLARSEERRVGKECRSRWVPDHSKKKMNKRECVG